MLDICYTCCRTFPYIYDVITTTCKNLSTLKIWKKDHQYILIHKKILCMPTCLLPMYNIRKRGDNRLEHESDVSNNFISSFHIWGKIFLYLKKIKAGINNVFFHLYFHLIKTPPKDYSKLYLWNTRLNSVRKTPMV